MRPSFTIILISAILVVACGDENAPANPSTDTAIASADADSSDSSFPDDPCALITNEEMSELLGNPVEATQVNATLCEYSHVEGTGITSDVFVNSASSSDCEIELSVGNFDSNPAVNGLSQAAYWKFGGNTHQLIVCTGEVFMVTTLYQLPGSDKLPEDTALATARGIVEKALTRL